MPAATLLRRYLRYISLNSIAMVGLSLYIFADTFFIAFYVGKTGLAALNLALPIFYLFINGPAMLLGTGAGAHFSIATGRRTFATARNYAQAALFAGGLYALVFILLFWLNRPFVLRSLGAGADTYEATLTYLSYLVSFSFVFLSAYILLALVRNDGNPRLAMIAMLLSNFVNIFFDWLFMGPLQMGIAGAALATGFSPVAGLIVLAFHFLREDRILSFQRFAPHAHHLREIVPTGTPAFIIEVANGATIFVFNWMLLHISGTIAVSAYSIIANTALMVICLFNGIAQGMQPLVSHAFGGADRLALKRLWRWGWRTMLGVGALITLFGYLQADAIVALFNKGGDPQLAHLAGRGLRLYYLGFLISGINLMAICYFAAIADSRPSILISLARAVLLPLPLLFILTPAFGLDGVWLAIPLAETLTFTATFIFIYRKKQKSPS